MKTYILYDRKQKCFESSYMYFANSQGEYFFREGEKGRKSWAKFELDKK